MGTLQTLDKILLPSLWMLNDRYQVTPWTSLAARGTAAAG